MDKVRLISPNLAFKTSFIEALDETAVSEFRGYTKHLLNIHKDKNSLLAWLSSNFPQYLANVNQKSDSARDIPKIYANQVDYWLVSKTKFIGRCTIRQKVIKLPFRPPGHIGLFIRPSMRGQGFGSILFNLSLKKARVLGFKNTVVCCSLKNKASLAILNKDANQQKIAVKQKENKKVCFLYST